MALRREYVDELLDKVNIVDVIRDFIPLKQRKRGNRAEFYGLCPFHSEQSPSFTVTAHKRFYHCFSCGAHGRVVDFLKEYNYLSYQEAVYFLAKRYRYFPRQWRIQHRRKDGKKKLKALRESRKRLCICAPP